MTKQQAAAYQRKLQTVVARYSNCLSSLSSQSARVLVLRSGVGVDRAYSAQQVARKLDISVAREARIEQTALTQLQRAGRGGHCGSSFVMLDVPAADRLASVSPLLVAATGNATATQAIAAAGSGGRTAVAGAHRSRSSASGQTFENAAIRIASSTPVALSILGGLGLLVMLASLSAAGRRLAAREQLVMAGTAATASPVAIPVVPPPAEQAPAERPAEQGFVGPPPTEAPPHEPPPTKPEAWLPPGEVPASQPAAPPDVAVTAAWSPPPPVQPDHSIADWARTHRSHIALALTAIAGGTLRALAKRRRR